MAKKCYIGIDGKARKVKKIYVGATESYRVVEYIESSGTQYIDTGFKPNQDTRVYMETVFPATSNTIFLFGARANSNTIVYQFAANSSKYRTDYNSNTTIKSIGTSYGTTKFYIDKNKNVTDLNGEYSHSHSYAAFELGISMYLFATNSSGSPADLATAKLYSCQIYDNGTLVRDYVPCISPSNAVGLYDMVNDVFYANVGSGVFTAGNETGEVITNNNVARKIKKAYIGVGGVARPCYSLGGLSYYGEITPLSGGSTIWLAGASNPNYAIFAGGDNGANTSNADAYSATLTKTTATALGVARYYLAGASVGNYAIFAGGYTSKAVSNVDAYSSSLTKSTPTSLTSAAGCLAGAKVGNYAIFAGGGSFSSGITTAQSYNTSLTKSSVTSLSQGRYYLSGASIGNYALFAGGTTNSYASTFNTVDTYNTSLTKSTATALSQARYVLAGASNSNYALFAGGEAGSSHNACNNVDAYNTNLTRTTPTALSAARTALAGTSAGEYILFGGGVQNTSTMYSVVDVYDANLTKTTQYFNKATAHLAGASIGSYGLFAAGVVDAFVAD